VLADFARRNGRVRGGGLVIVLLGKAGSREMMAGSDLDLMFIYDHPASVTESDGARKMAPSQWFIRAVHAVVAAITAPDAAGPTYAIDMRLRPSGNKGPVAVSLAGFERYHARDAWTWERMALTRARIVAGPPALRRRVAGAIRAAIRAAGPPDRIRADAAAMRARMLRDTPPTGPWDEKLRVGGQIEVEFIAQTLQLVHPAIAGQTTRGAFAALRDAGVLDAADAALLILADRAWRTVQGMLRITEGREAPADLPAASAAALLRAGSVALGMELADIAALRAALDALAARVRAAFTRLVAPIEVLASAK
jgi:glutamate-ammonia-ligase adenylyltransferase